MDNFYFWGRDQYDERLLEEVHRGVKTATCTPKVWYDEVPETEKYEIGEQVKVYTKTGEYSCTIEITDVYEIPFGEIKGDTGERIAKGENSTLEEYIDDHIFCWKDEMEEQGHGFGPETVIVVEHFKMVSPEISDIRRLHIIPMLKGEVELVKDWGISFTEKMVMELDDDVARKDVYFAVFREKDLVAFFSFLNERNEVQSFMNPVFHSPELEEELNKTIANYCKLVK